MLGRPSRLAGPIAGLALALLAGCGQSAHHGAGQSSPTGAGAPGVLHGTIRLADCTDWRRGPESQRRATIVALRGFYSGPVTSGNAGARTGHGPLLDNGLAYRILERFCAQSFAGAFKLYKLYGRAAAFAPRNR